MSRNAWPQMQREEAEKEDRLEIAREERWSAEADAAWVIEHARVGNAVTQHKFLLDIAEAAFKRGYMAAKFA